MDAPDPVLVRMFVDDVSGIGLWPAGCEGTLPIPVELRRRIQSWVDEYTDSVLGPLDRYGEQWTVDHSWRGHDLSQELQAALGDRYYVEYQPNARADRDGTPLPTVRWSRLSASELDELPEIPAGLRERLSTWSDQRPRFEDDPVELYADRYAWEDEGMDIRRELQRVLGPSYHVEPW
jgi:hypothetical protein